jgi:trehalose 6-phosphate synthase/phosphatase
MLAARFMDAQVFRRLQEEYRGASARLLLLDYDGTLVPLAETPEQAYPDREILAALGTLSGDPRNTVVIISGRERAILDRWFGSLDVGLVAEHGIWVRERGGEWEMTRTVTKEWKEEIRPILELYVDRTPGTFVEEKEYSLAWHFRNADPGLAGTRSIELREDLMPRTKNLHLALLEGDKVVEVKNADIHKGTAVSHWLGKGARDLILAIGDDRTDEDLFAAVPGDAWTIKVGPHPSRAAYSVRSVNEVRKILAGWISPPEQGREGEGK